MKTRKGSPVSQPQLSRMIDHIYEAALAGEATLLQELGEILGAPRTWEASVEIKGKKPRYRANTFRNVTDTALAADCAAAQPSPWTLEASRRAPGTVWRTSELVPLSELARHDFYHDFVELLRIHCRLGAQHLIEQGGLAIQTLHRDQGAGDFGDSEAKLFGLLAPHLRRAAILSMHLRRIRSESTVTQETLDQLTIGVILVDRRGRSVFVNRSAEEILSAGDGLRLVDRALHAWLDSETGVLSKLLATAACPGTIEAGGELAITRPSGLHPLGVRPLGRTLVMGAP